MRRGKLGHLDVGASGGLNLLLDQYEYHYGDKATDAAPSRARIVVGRAVGRGAARHDPWARTGAGDDAGDRATSRRRPRPDRRHRSPGCADGSRRASGRTRPTGSIACGPRSGWPPRRPRPSGAATPSGRSTPASRDVGIDAHPVVTNSWVLNYLTPSDRLAYVAELDRIGAERDLSWVFAETPELVPELPITIGELRSDVTALTIARWRRRCANGRDRRHLPSARLLGQLVLRRSGGTRKRHGVSTALVMPIRGPTKGAAGGGCRRRGCGPGSTGRSGRARSASNPIPNAWPILPGPSARSTSFDRTAPGAHHVDAVEGLDRADQDRGAHAVRRR